MESNPPPKGDPKVADYREALRAVKTDVADLATNPKDRNLIKAKAGRAAPEASRKTPAPRVNLESSDSEDSCSEDREFICGAKCLHKIIRRTKIPASFSLPTRHHKYSGAGDLAIWLKGHLDAILHKGGTTITAM